MARCLPFALAVCLLSSPALASSFSVGAAFTWHRSDGRSATSALLVLELPLERMARPRVPWPSPARLLEDAAPAGSAPLRPVEEARAAPAKPRRAEARSPGLLRPQLVRKVVQAALRARGAGQTAERLDGLASRSRTSAALPELTLRALRSNDQTLRLSPTTASAYDYTQTGGAGLLLEARAVWHLDHLVFAEQELRVEQLRAEQLRVSERLISDVIKYLFALQQARAQLERDDLLPDESLRAELEAAQAAAVLDVLTEGAFTELERENAASARAAPAPAELPRASAPRSGSGAPEPPKR